jgi:hypothetical protein
VGQRGFWNDQQRIAKLQEKNPVLKRPADSIPWESFRPLLDKGYAQERKSNAGCKRINPLILFKMLVLQQLFNLSDQELEFQVNDRRLFENFVGPGVMNSIPDTTTVAFFRDRLLKAGVIDVKASQHQVTTNASTSGLAPGARLQASIDRQGRLVLVPSQYEPEELFLHRPKVNRCLSLEQMEQTIAAAAGNPNDREDA